MVASPLLRQLGQRVPLRLVVWPEGEALDAIQPELADFVNRERVELTPADAKYLQGFIKGLEGRLERAGLAIDESFYEFYVSLSPSADADPLLTRKTYDLPSGEAVQLLAATARISGGRTGLAVWEASIRLSEMILALPPRPALQFLELGCGLGLAGLVAALAGPALLTDGSSSVVAAAERNAARNPACRAAVAELNWDAAMEEGRLPDPVTAFLAAAPDTLIFGADLIYNPVVFPSLTWVMRLLRERGTTLAVTLRNGETFNAFLDACSAAGLVCETLFLWRAEKVAGYDPLPRIPPAYAGAGPRLLQLWADAVPCGSGTRAPTSAEYAPWFFVEEEDLPVLLLAIY